MPKTARLIALLLASGILPLIAVAEDFPPPTSGEFCQAVQRFTANTDKVGEITVFDNMPDYRASKPFVDPLTNYQVVTYAGQMPIMVSCKVKGSAHLRSAYGDDIAGEQRYCPDVARELKAAAVAELTAAGDTQAATAAQALVIDDIEPYTTGQSYLSDFNLSYVGDDGAVHISSPGLFQDYDSWVTLILPERVEGQVYCHLATVDYMKGLATGAIEPGTPITTVDGAPTQPQ